MEKWVQISEKNFLIVRTIKPGNKLPREAVKSLSSEVFKKRLDRHFCDDLGTVYPASVEELDSMITRFLPNCNAVILTFFQPSTYLFNTTS